MSDQEDTSRRSFLKTAAATVTLAGSEAPFAQEPKVSANDFIRIATIGIGGKGTGDTRTALRVPGVRLVAVADVYDGRLIRAKEVFGESIFTTRDYREILTRSDVDAVIIATPDPWHVRQTIDAMEAGKDVYVEKPVVQVVEDGHRLIEAERRTRRICQVGSQRVSSIVFLKAKQLLAAGVLGELNLGEAWGNRNSALGAGQYSIPPDASPQNIDWDRFLGDAPRRPFEPTRLFRWRNYRDYGTGISGDLFVHLFSAIHLVTGSNGPVRVMATGGLRFWKDGRDVPDVMLGLYDYAGAGEVPSLQRAVEGEFCR